MAKRTVSGPEDTAPHGGRGARGERGERGEAGPRGETGPVASKEHILAVVAEQFKAIQKQLDMQLIRTGEVQAELDLQRQDTRELRAQVKQVHALLRQSLKTPQRAVTPEREFDRE